MKQENKKTKGVEMELKSLLDSRIQRKKIFLRWKKEEEQERRRRRGKWHSSVAQYGEEEEELVVVVDDDDDEGDIENRRRRRSSDGIRSDMMMTPMRTMANGASGGGGETGGQNKNGHFNHLNQWRMMMMRPEEEEEEEEEEEGNFLEDSEDEQEFWRGEEKDLLLVLHDHHQVHGTSHPHPTLPQTISLESSQQQPAPPLSDRQKVPFLSCLQLIPANRMIDLKFEKFLRREIIYFEKSFSYDLKDQDQEYQDDLTPKDDECPPLIPDLIQQPKEKLHHFSQMLGLESCSEDFLGQKQREDNWTKILRKSKNNLSTDSLRKWFEFHDSSSSDGHHHPSSSTGSSIRPSDHPPVADSMDPAISSPPSSLAAANCCLPLRSPLMTSSSSLSSSLRKVFFCLKEIQILFGHQMNSKEFSFIDSMIESFQREFFPFPTTSNDTTTNSCSSNDPSTIDY